MIGTVYLVGAGPGDPGLLTLRAAELLGSAEVVAHDSLVPPALLELAPPEAERIPVGRRHGDGRPVHRLHPTVLDRARAGRDVVRLKCGDPLTFARGGEEAEALAAGSVPFQIIPGISAAHGAAAYAGIPLTHRDHASAVTLATGHRAARASSTSPPRAGTLILYMATRRLPQLVAELVADGRDPDEPAACVGCATRREQTVVTAPLAALPDRVARAAVPLPALVVVGDVAAAGANVAWTERCPLLGRSIAIAGAAGEERTLAAALRRLGARVNTTDTPAPIPDLLVLASDAAARRLYAADRGRLTGVPTIAIGTRTAQTAMAAGAADVHCRAALDAGVLAVIRSWLEGPALEVAS